MKYCFGVDIGGTTVKMGLFSTEGDLYEKWEIKTHTENEGKQVLPDIAASVRAKMEEKGIYVSSGSACSSNHPSVSGVLKGIGAAREYLDATLRFSMSEFTKKEEIDYTLDTLYNCVPTLRKYTRH